MWSNWKEPGDVLFDQGSQIVSHTFCRPKEIYSINKFIEEV